ncbi:MAG TPA: MFS transporter [Candidatus Limnocylindria bacterium]|nr:MFS transporter [Candidatus Limnocylindria bacterium]
MLGSSVVFLDSTVVNVALPRIGRELPSHVFGVLEGQSYVYNGYLLTLSALLILAGAASDFYGRRRMFGIGVVAFGLISALCGLAPSMEWLVVFRVLQGAAGALLVPGSLSLISAAFSGEEEGRAIGTWSAASAATTLLGPFVGGVLVDTISWRVAFLINVPLAVVALYAVVRHVQESKDPDASGHFDWLGATVVALAVGGLAFGAISGQQREWRDPLAYVSLAVGIIALIALPVYMLRSRHPLIPPSLFRSRTFTVTNISTLLIYGALYVVGYNAGLFQQGILGYTAAAAGLGFIPGSLLLALMSRRFGALAGRYGPRWFMAAGAAIMAVGILWFARIPVTSQAWVLRPDHPASFLPPASYWIDIFPASVILGIGLCMLVAPLTTALMTSVPPHNAGLASAINNAVSRVGPQLVGAAIFVVVTATFYSSLASRTHLDVTAPGVRQQISPLNRPGASVSSDDVAAVRQASTEAFHLAMMVAAGLLFAGALINAVGIESRHPAAAQPGGPVSPVPHTPPVMAGVHHWVHRRR